MARWRLIGILVICVAALVACGDSGGSTDSSSSGADSGSGAKAPANGGKDSGSAAGVPSANCLAGTQAFVAASASLGAVLGGDSKQFESSVAELEKWANSAPSAIQKDIKVVAAAYTSYAKALKDAGYKPGVVPDAKVMSAMEKASASLESADFEKASANVDAWFEKECKS